MAKLLRLVLRLARVQFLFLGFMLYLMRVRNDYFDRHSDKNSTITAFSGGSKVLIEHPELESLALNVAIFLLAMSIIGNAVFTFAHYYSY